MSLHRKLKRLTDILVSASALLLLAPFLMTIAVLVIMTSRGPAIFRQERIGLGGKPFRILKFRTMIADAASLGRETAGRNDPRITPIGRILRKSKIDELPQLINVLIGDMSLVGPRPEIPFYAERYIGEEQLVFTVRPGITDASSLELADLDDRMDQRDGLSPAEFYERFILPRKKLIQLAYVRNPSFAKDFIVLWHTFWRVLRRGLWR